MPKTTSNDTTSASSPSSKANSSSKSNNSKSSSLSKSNSNGTAKTAKIMTNDRRKEIEKMIAPTLYRLTDGIPQHELRLMVQEAQECEKMLLAEIALLEKAKTQQQQQQQPTQQQAQQQQPITPQQNQQIQAICMSELSPPDRFYTISALMGRLREPLLGLLPHQEQLQQHRMTFYQQNNKGIPPIHPSLHRSQQALAGAPASTTTMSSRRKKQKETSSSSAAAGANSSSSTNYHTGTSVKQSKKKSSSSHVNSSSSSLSSPTHAGGNSSSKNNNHFGAHHPVVTVEYQKTMERYQQLVALETYQEYRKKHEQTTQLLACLKKISSHRTATVFRRAVNPAEAPGYTDRILFPIDLSLVRKMITAKMIQSFAELHLKLGLICHNCVKFNGKDSDYAVVTRDFETHVDDCIIQTVHAAAASGSLTTGSSTSTKRSNSPKAEQSK